MPVKKSSASPSRKTTTRRTKTVPAMAKKTERVETSVPSSCVEKKLCHGTRCGSFVQKIMLTFIGIFLVYLIVYVGTLIRNEMQEYHYIGKADQQERTINLEAEGKVEVKPTMASVSMGVVTEAETVSDAQNANTEKMNTFIARLQEIGIPEEDIKTGSYNVFPQYVFTEENGRELVGYSVNQQVDIRIDDTELADRVIALAGELELNQVSELSYEIGERDEYLDQARQDALQKIADKAVALSKALGVKIVGVVTYNEYEVIGNAPQYRYEIAQSSATEKSTPNLQPGTNEVIIHANVTFEIR